MNFLETLLGFLEKLWPFQVVDQWERGVFYVCGRALKRVLKPGVYPYIPFFMRIDTAPVVPSLVSSPLLTVTLTDKNTLSFSVTAQVRVVDAWKAINEIDDYEESVSELISSTVAEKLAEVDAARLDPEKRKRLVSDLVRWVNGETEQYGLRVDAIRFTNFAINLRSYRLMMDTGLAGMKW